MFCVCPEERPPGHQPSGCGGPVLGSERLVLPDVPRTEGHQAPSADAAVSDGDDPPPALQQPRRAAGGDQDDTGELLPAAQLEPSAGLRAAGQAELGGQPVLPAEPDAK